MKNLIFSFCVALPFLVMGCGGENIDDLPPLGGADDPGYYEYGYCRYGNNSCQYMSVSDCYNYYGGSNYGSDNSCGVGYSSSSYGYEYGYCRYYNGYYRCEYMNTNDCYNYYGGSNYGSDSNCGGYEPEPPQPASSSSVRSSSSSYVYSSSSHVSYEYGYCGYYSGNYRCEYMDVNDCYNYYGGSNYGSDNSCGGYNYPSSSSYGGFTGTYGSVYYEGQYYRTVAIGSQTWMADNLNYAPSSGTFISCGSYDCATYGRLYDWATAMNLPSSCNYDYCSGQVQYKHQGICPYGWHIPSDDDWAALENFVGGSSTAGRYLKATSGWYDNGNGTDQYGFSALPGGYGGSVGSFDDVGYGGYWWSASEYNSNNAYYRNMYYNSEYALWDINYKSNLFSVRCLQD